MAEKNPEKPSLILEMAKDYEEKGEICNAINLYKEILNEHPESKEAALSRESLIRIAGDYVKEDNYHKAVALYKEILNKY